MVMNILNRKLLRDLWKNKGQFISALIIVVIGVMFYTSLNSAYRNLEGASQRYYKENRFADLWASVLKAPGNMEERIGRLPFVEMVTGRIIEDVNLEIGGENAVIRLNTLPDERKNIVNDIVIRTGRYFSQAELNQCLVEESFFKAHNLQEGDYLYPIINGREVKLQVIGSVLNPEYVYSIKDATELMPDNRKFGVVYIKESFGQSVFGYEGSYNSIALTIKEGTDLAKAKDEVEELLREFGVISIVDRDSQVSSKMVSEEIRGIQSVAGAFPIAFFVIAAVIIYISMTRMVENQRTEIGVLKAFGYSNRQVLFHYMANAGLIAIMGSILGSLLGILLGIGYTQLIGMYFNFPTTDMKLYPELVLPSSLLVLAFCLLAGYNSSKSILSIMPSEAMRPKAPLQAKKIPLERVDFIWKNLSNSWKMTLRNIFRYKRRALLTSVGIIFATAITLFAFAEKNSIDYLIEQQYTNIQNYDLKVNFSKFLNREELNSLQNISYVTAIEPVIETGVELTNGWRKKDLAFTGLVIKPTMYKVVDKKGTPVTIPASGILIPEKLARTLGVGTGDTVFIKSYLPGKEKREVRIRGIIAQYLGTSAYASLQTANALLGEGSVANSAVIRLSDDNKSQEVIKTLQKMPEVSSVLSRTDALNNLVKNMEVMTSAIGAMIALSGVMAIAVIYNITTINIFERQRELATLMVLGFKDSEVSRLIFNENYSITMLGILLGLPFGKWLGASLLAAFETDAYSIPFVVKAEAYFVTTFLIFAFTFLANWALSKKIRRINMVEVLKSNE
jgi:putative ABC transport system permease protein